MIWENKHWGSDWWLPSSTAWGWTIMKKAPCPCLRGWPSRVFSVLSGLLLPPSPRSTMSRSAAAPGRMNTALPPILIMIRPSVRRFI